jgi:ketosteroid isomerase-like protein
VTAPAAVVLVASLLLVPGCTKEIDLSGGRDSLLEADRDFAAQLAEEGSGAWADWFLEDGIMFPAQGRAEGREAIRRIMQIYDKPHRLVMEPSEAFVAASGDLGYTIGRWRSLGGSSGDSLLASGNYLSIWKKDPAGRWRMAVDIGNPDPGEDDAR